MSTCYKSLCLLCVFCWERNLSEGCFRGFEGRPFPSVQVQPWAIVGVCRSVVRGVSQNIRNHGSFTLGEIYIRESYEQIIAVIYMLLSNCSNNNTLPKPFALQLRGCRKIINNGLYYWSICRIYRQRLRKLEHWMCFWAHSCITMWNIL